MFTKLTLAAGFGAGYVLGAKAGRERYQQLEAKFREVAGMPAVQNATSTVKETASGLADSAKSTVNEKVEQVSDRGDKGDSVDLDAARSSSGAPMAGAAASGTAPETNRP